MSSLPNPFNLPNMARQKLLAVEKVRLRSGEEISVPSAYASAEMQKYLSNLNRVIRGMAQVNVQDFGARGNDTFDDAAAFNNAIQTVSRMGGGVVYIPYTEGAYIVDFPIIIPAGCPPIMFIGDGVGSLVKRRGNMPNGVGIFDVNSSNVIFENFAIDGGTTIPVGLQYSADFTGVNANDPMADSLTRNTSVWIHGGVSGFRFQNMLFTHASGYTLLGDARTGGDITDIEVLNCILRNNRPTLFGTTPGDLVYGSWNGGIFWKGDARNASGDGSYVVKNVLVMGCRFERGNGNQLWSHNYGFENFHQNLRYIGNQFLDCGLDGILVQCVTGGIVSGNIFRRIGYTTLTDTDRSYPRWLPGLNATAIDSGVVKGVPYVGNSIISPNGGSIDLDTHCMSTISANLIRVPYVGEPEYEEDQIAIIGIGNAGNTSYGLNMAVNYPIAEGGAYVNAVGNTILNLRSGAIRFYSSRYGNIQNNIIQAPADSLFAPITLGPNGAQPYNRCYGTKITGNQIEYDPATPGDPCVLESDGLSGGNPMTAGEANTVCNNVPLQPSGTTAVEFEKAPGSGSVVYSDQVWF